MSQYIGKLYHPENKYPVDVYSGFSWPCLFTGVFWYVTKGMILWSIASIILSFVTYSVSWFVLPFFANQQHYDYLRTRGYLTKQELEGKNF